MIPCYVDVFYPEVGIATLELLERLGVEVEYPFDQTCCGQPMANSGCEADARGTEELFIRNFSAFEYIVIPSGSCTHHIRNKFIAAPPGPERDHVQSHVYDLVEFLHEHLAVFIRLLTRSATGMPITQYTSHFRAPREGGEMHVVLVDNGRSDRLGMEKFWPSLKCIRCGACMNTCP